MAIRIILADTQVIFRAGVARVLAMEGDLRVVAQCADLQHLEDAIGSSRSAIVIFPSDISSDLGGLLDTVQRAGSKSVVIAEKGVTLNSAFAKRIDGVVWRSIAGPQLVECLRRVAVGKRSVQRPEMKPSPFIDHADDRILQRLTPKELQVIALISEGGKNKIIAERLGTKEQVIKNHLRNIYGKLGVSDRLELAVFTQHHRTLADVAARVRREIMERALAS